jgi:adenylate cyclase
LTQPPSRHPPAGDEAGYSRTELALEAHVAESEVDRLVDARVLRPVGGSFSWVDIYRVRTVRAMEVAGIPLERSAAEFDSGRLDLDFLGFTLPRPSPLTGQDFRTFVGSLGERGAHVGAVYEMLGIVHPADDMPMRDDETSMIREMLDLWAEDPEIMKRAARIAGYAVRLLVEGWTSLHYELYRGLGGGGRERWPAEVREREPYMAMRAVGLAKSLPAWLIARHHEQVLISDIIENIEMQVDPFAERDPSKGGVRQPAIVFIDLSGYTALTTGDGDRVAAATTMRFEEAVSVAAWRDGGRVVKLLGDGALLRFDRVSDAVRSSLVIRAALDDMGVRTHAGIDCGPIAERDGDVFGRTVNMAARLANSAEPGQVLVTAAVAESARQHGIEASSLGSLQLKGMDGPVPVFELPSLREAVPDS